MTQNRLAFVGATLIDGSGRNPVTNAVVVVEGKSVLKVGRKSQTTIPRGFATRDVSGKTLMPGMFDCHIHISYMTKSIEKRLFIPPSLSHFQTAAMMMRVLHAGFTTIRVPGTQVDAGFRMASDQGMIEAPRLVVAGRLGQTGGHFDDYYPCGVQLPFLDAEMCDGVPEVQRAARRVLRKGFDFIKICSTGGVASPADSPEYTEWTMEELKAIVYEANARGKAVMAHAEGNQGIKNALMARVWSVEHGSMLDDEAIQMFLDTGIYLVPTLYIVEDILKRGKEIGLSDVALQKINIIKDVHAKSFEMAVAAGVKIGSGTDMIDAGSYGKNAQELVLMCQHGMTPMQAIVAATKTSAEVCRVDQTTGTLEAGKLADLLVVDGDPLKDISVLQDQSKLLMVMKEGKSYVNRLG